MSRENTGNRGGTNRNYQTGVALDTGRPVLSFALLIVGAMCAWWLRGRNAVGEIAGLKAQIAARDATDEIAGLKAQLAARDERLQLAREQNTGQKSSVDDALARITDLVAQQKSGASPAQIALTTSALSNDLYQTARANSAIGAIVATVSARQEDQQR